MDNRQIAVQFYRDQPDHFFSIEGIDPDWPAETYLITDDNPLREGFVAMTESELAEYKAPLEPSVREFLNTFKRQPDPEPTPE